MEYFVYVLITRPSTKGKRGYLTHRYLTYVGWTLDPERRLAEHNAGTGARSTRGRVWTLLHVEQWPSRQEAMRREWHLKRDRRLRKQLADAWLAKVRLGKEAVVAVAEPAARRNSRA
jgi:predicted GIY-YIG superfamily endonuclease